MNVAASLLPELEEVVQHGSAEKRANTLRRITSLFLDGAANYQRRTRRAVRRRHRRLDRGDRGQGAGRTGASARAGAQCAAWRGDDARQERRHRRRRPGAQAGSSSPTRISNISPRPRARRICWRCPPAWGSARRCRTCWCGAATARWRAASPPIIRRVCRRTRSPLWSSAPRRDGVLAEKVGLRTDIPPRLFRQLLMQASERGAAAPAGARPSRRPGPKSGACWRK